MAGKVTHQQIAQNTRIEVDQFRKMVNTVNPKNKGYVRFVPDGKGGVSIAKVNNKIDILIGWRTNINVDNNKAMRAKFADSIQDALRWVDQEKVNTLLGKIKNTADGELNTAALSRKEVQAVMRAYDAEMNTVEGRTKMVDNLLKSTAEKCGFGKDAEGVEAFKAKYLTHTARGTLNIMLKVGEDGAPHMEELAFRTSLRQIEKECHESVSRAAADQVIEQAVQEVSVADAPKEDFGVHLAQDNVSKLRAHLHQSLAPTAEKSFGVKAGMFAMLFEKFITDVLPKLYEQGVGQVHAYNGAADKTALLSVEHLKSEAESFIRGAIEDLKNEQQFLDYVVTDDKQIDETLGYLQDNARLVVGLAEKRVIDSNLKAINCEVNLPEEFDPETGKKLPKSALMQELQDNLESKEALKSFRDGAQLNVYTQNFLAARGIGEAVDWKKTDYTEKLNKVLDNIETEMQKLKVAAQINYGDRTVVENKIIAQNNGAYVYLHDMANSISTISVTSELDSAALQELLLSYTLPNIMNQKIEFAALGLSKNVAINDSRAVEAADREKIRTTAEACITFEEGVKAAFTKENDALDKLLNAQKKNGLLTDGEIIGIKDRFQTKLTAAHKAALEAFFLESPAPTVEDGVAHLKQFFNEKLNDVRAEVRNELALSALASAGATDARDLLANISERIRSALTQPGLPDLTTGGLVTDETARRMLKNGAVQRLYTAILAENLKQVKTGEDGRAVFEDTFGQKVINQFNKAVKALFNDTSEKLKTLMSHVNERITEGTTYAVEHRMDIINQVRPEGEKKVELAKAEKKALITEISREVIHFRSASLRKIAEKILTSPEAVDKDTVTRMADDFVSANGVETTGRAFDRIMDARITAVKDFLKDKSIMQQLSASVAANGIFGKDGKFAALGPNERDAIVRHVVDRVAQRAALIPFAYAASDPGDIFERLMKEALTAADEFAGKWQKFHAKFSGKVAAIESPYAAMTQEALAKVRDYFLGEQFSAFIAKGELLSIDAAIDLYKNHLNEEAVAVVERKQKEAEKQMNAVMFVLDPAMKEVKKALMDKVGAFASQYDIALDTAEYLYDTIIQKKMAQVRDLITANPANFNPNDGSIPKFIETEITAFVNFARDVLLANAFNTQEQVLKQVDKLASDTLRKMPEAKAAAVEDLMNWLTSDAGLQLCSAAEKALLDRVLTANPAVDTPETLQLTEPGNAVEQLYTEARKVLDGHSVSLLVNDFRTDSVGVAREAFTSWLNTHMLNRNSEMKAIQSRVHEKIMTLFDTRVALLQQAVANGEAPESILSTAFMAQIDEIIDSEGAIQVLTEWKEKQTEAWMAQFRQTGEWTVFDTQAEGFSALPAELRSIIQQNADSLETALSLALSELAGKADGQGGLADLRKNLAAITPEQIAAKIHEDTAGMIVECARRYTLEAGAKSTVANYSYSIERTLIKAVISEKNQAKFPNGLSDILVHLGTNPKLAAKHVQTVAKAITVITETVNTAFTDELERAREQESDIAAFTANIISCSEGIVSDVLNDKTLWKKALLPALKAIDKELK